MAAEPRLAVMWNPQDFPQWQAMQYLQSIAARFGPAATPQVFYVANSVEAERQLLIARRGWPALSAYIGGRLLIPGSPWEDAARFAGLRPEEIAGQMKDGEGSRLFRAQAPPAALIEAYRTRKGPVLLAGGLVAPGPPSLLGWTAFIQAELARAAAAPDRRVLARRPRIPKTLTVFTMTHCSFGNAAVGALMEGLARGTVPAGIAVHIRYIVQASTGSPPAFRSLHGAAEWEEAARQKIIRKHFPDTFGKYLAVRNRSPDSSLWEDAARAAGLEPQVIRDRFEEGRRDLRDDARLVKELGITSSPTFLWENRLVLVGLQALKSVPGFQRLPASATGGCGVQTGGLATEGRPAADWNIREVAAAWLTTRMPDGVKTVTPQALRARQLRNDSFVLVDARHRADYEAKHIAGAVSVLRWKVPGENRIQPPWSLDTEIVVYCQSLCRASARVLEELWAKGYRRLWHLPAGPEEWEKMGFPVEGRDVRPGG